MKNIAIKIFLAICITAALTTAAYAESKPKVMALDFQLNDLTDLPNAPQELERIAYLSTIYKQKLADDGIELVPVVERLKVDMTNQSPTYLYEHIEYAAEAAKDSGAEYLLIGVALKPTYLFVYPRILLVDIKQQKVVMSKAAQLESSWTDKETTAKTAEKLAQIVADQLMKIEQKSELKNSKLN